MLSAPGGRPGYAWHNLLEESGRFHLHFRPREKSLSSLSPLGHSSRDGALCWIDEDVHYFSGVMAVPQRRARGGARGARGAPISARTAAHGSRSAAIARDVFLQPRLQQTQPPKCRPDSASRYVRACSNDQSKTSPRSALTSVCPTKSCPSFRSAPPPPSRKPLDRGLRNSLGEPLLRRRGA